PTASIEPRVAAQTYALIKELAAAGKAVLLVDQNIRGALEIADYAYVMRTGAPLTEGPRGGFRGDTEAPVARWLYASDRTAGQAGGGHWRTPSGWLILLRP